MSRSVKPERGQLNARYHLANSGEHTTRAVDRLRCDRGTTHDVRMEWEVRQGVRTGRLTAYCWSCQRQVAVRTTEPPRDTYAYRQNERTTQRYHRRKGA